MCAWFPRLLPRGRDPRPPVCALSRGRVWCGSPATCRVTSSSDSPRPRARVEERVGLRFRPRRRLGRGRARGAHCPVRPLWASSREDTEQGESGTRRAVPGLGAPWRGAWGTRVPGRRRPWRLWCQGGPDAVSLESRCGGLGGWMPASMFLPACSRVAPGVSPRGSAPATAELARGPLPAVSTARVLPR